MTDKFVVKENMFQTLKSFEYYACDNCECLQIGTIPENMPEYYPKEIKEFRQQAKKLNLSSQGDQASFILSHNQ